MKTIFILIIYLCLTMIVQAQVSKTVDVTAGNLSNLLTTTELKTITELTLTGTMDVRDFMLLRDSMPVLAQLDLKNVSVVSYSDVNGENEIPELAFNLKSSLITIQLPLTLKAINGYAFQYCTSLTTIDIPSSVTDIGEGAFIECSSLTAITIPTSVTAIKSSTFKGCISLTSFIIPSSVTTIGSWAFSDCRSMTSISIPSLVTSIGNYAFYACLSLTSLTIPSSITSIEEATFSSLSSITSLTIPSSVTTIGNKAFMGCNSLTSVNIPSSVTYIGDEAFMRCGSLTSVTLPPSVTSINDNTFWDCEALTSVVLPATITSIGKSAFGNCIHLEAVQFPSSVTRIRNASFAGCTRLTEITLPSHLIALEEGAFFGCLRLETVTIPSSVSHIGPGAFDDCSSLKNIYMERSIPVEVEFKVFPDTVKSSAQLHVPYGTAPLYSAANEWKDFTHIEPDSAGFMVSTNIIHFNATAGASQVTISSTKPWEASVDQPWVTLAPASGNNEMLTVKAEANGTTTNRTALITITSANAPPQQITVNQKSDPEVVVVTVGNLGYLLSKEEKDTITSLRLTGTINFWDIKTIDAEMPLLTDLDLSKTTMKATNGPQYYHQEIFYYPDNWFPGPTIYRDDHIADRGLTKPLLRHLQLPSLLEVIGALAFTDCTGLASVTIPSTVTAIGYAAFRNCSSLDSTTIPASVYIIADQAFSGCTSLKDVKIEGPLTRISAYTFRDCSSLTSVILPSTVQIIDNFAFSNCTSLSTISLPESLNGMEEDAFNNCSGLESIYSYNPLAPYTRGAFNGVDKSACTVYVPFGSGALYEEAEGWQEFENIVERLPEFRLSATTVSVKAGQGSTATVSLATDVTWSSSHYQQWLTITPGSASEDGTVTFTADANTSDFGRVDTVTFTAENFLPRKVIVIQEGLPKTVQLTAGNLSAALTKEELKGIVNLTITGEIDARDFITMRDRMPLLSILDLSKATIVYDTIHGAYNRKNSIPIYAFYSNPRGEGKSSLTSVLLPDSITDIDQVAFEGCTGLITITLPPAVNSILYNAFDDCINLNSIYSYPFNPPYLSPNIFRNVNKATCILYVPYGSKALYEKSDEWKVFRNIVEMTILEVSATQVTLEAEQGSADSITITGYGLWTLGWDQHWLAPDPVSGNGTHTITFTADANSKDTLRRATVTISAPGMEDKTIIVSQKGLITGMAEIDQMKLFLNYYPNPFTDELSIEVSNPLHKEVSVEIYSMSGQKIKTLLKGQKGAKISLVWNGVDENGKQVPEGMYLMKVNGEVRKVMKR